MPDPARRQAPGGARNIVRWVLSLVASAAFVVAVVVVVARSTDSGASAPTTTASPLSRQTVTFGDLVRTSKADGTLEYSDTITVWHRIDGEKATASTSGNSGGGATRPSSSGSSSATSRVTQVVTSITSIGTTIGNGDVLYTIDSQPVIALVGALPAWRTLSKSSAAGNDIAQLEQALVDLGYDPEGTLTVDDTFDSTTEAMVKRWQSGLGTTATGKVSLGSVVFIPKPSTVGTVARAVGDSVGDADEMLTLAGSAQRVTIDVPSGDESRWVPGLSVKVGSAAGTVVLLQSVDRNGSAIVQAVIVPDTPIEGAQNGATFTVTGDLLVAKDVFVVPSQALASRVDGSYAVQAVGGDGSVSWVPVTLEGVAGLRAGVLPVDSGSLADGATVLAPAA